MSMTGRCLCGQVSYVVEGEPMLTAICHCRHCQRQAGTAFSIIVAVAADAVSITGATKSFADKADSGAIVLRRFCPECGSPLFSALPTAPEVVYVKAGTLDNPTEVRPQIQIWCKSAQPWLTLDPGLPQFPENPPTAG